MTARTAALTCREVNDFLAAYVGDELTSPERSRFDEHLAECPDCVVFLRQYAATIEFTRKAYDDVTVADVPERLVKAIVDARSKEPPPTPEGRRRRRR